ncbi:MAG: hypothetical protein JWO91_2870 [Acidobacteriaceae bacterium]|nr:hypothetical protein [Acidobacteriaceae bacterium]
MKHSCRSAVVFMILLGLARSLHAQTRPTQHSLHQQETWYEFMLKQFNPSGFDYGAWLERRRRAFLEATLSTPYFWYSCSATAALFLLFIAYTKLQIDHRRSFRVTSDVMADLYNHDSYSRQIAKAAIEKYNRHVEQCNRAIEQAESGEGRAGWGDTHADAVKEELQRVAAQLEATTQDRDKLQEELRRKSVVIADLTTRIDALAKKMGGTQGGLEITRTAQVSPEGNGSDSKLIDQINRLQEELYAERRKNKRLKGA